MKKLIALFLVLNLILSSGALQVLAETGFSKERESLFMEEIKSERRQKYELLLEGNYYAGELREKFVELFGDEYSAEDIRQNYSEIFDIPVDEVDMGIIELLTHGYVDENDALFLQADQSRESTSRYLASDLFIEADIYPEPPQIYYPVEEVYPIDEQIDIIDPEATLDNDTVPQKTDIDMADDMALAATSTSFNSITLVSKTNTSVTFDMWFKKNDQNDILQKYDKSISQTWSYLLGRDGKPKATSQRYTATGLVAGAVYTFRVSSYDNGTWHNSEIIVQTSGAKTPSLTVTGKTSSSITVNAVFPTEGAWGNRLRYYNGLEWLNATNQDELHVKSGTYTINGLLPGIAYVIYADYYNHMTGTWQPEIRLDEALPLPAVNMQTYTRSNMSFSLEKWFADSFTAGRLNRFLDKLNNAYQVQYNLVGGSKPHNGATMQFETSRNLPAGTEGLSGNPIKWSISTAATHLLRMNQLNVDMTETPIHEIGHNFDKPSWTFEAEALTLFKIYHYMKTTNETIAVNSIGNPIIGASGYKAYMKSHAQRGQGHINYDAAMAQGVYSPYSLAFRLSEIYDIVGAAAFMNTFRYFDNLESSSVPTNSLDKFNLFISKLRDYSGQDVLNMFTGSEKLIFADKMDPLSHGTIRYVSRELSITRVQQAYKSWCWAASCEMVGSYLAPSLGRTQADIAEHVKGPTLMFSGAFEYELRAGLNYACGKTTGATTVSVGSFLFHQNKIEDSIPLIARFFWNGSDWDAHDVVVSGYNDITKVLQLTDPWYNCGSREYYYTDLIKGTTIQSGSGAKYVQTTYLS